jgi:pimeloyl-ACP methyl ester carboxylesterase
MKKMLDSYESAWKQIVSPERMNYPMSLGPELLYNSKQDLLKRVAFSIINKKGLRLSGFTIINQRVPQCDLPCLVYLHSHSGTKAEALQITQHLLDHFNICSFDFSGYGDSQGEFGTLGLKEHDDLRCVIDYLRETLDIEDIYLWGRSMGAVTCILYDSYHKNQEVQGIVLDSPFTETKTMLCDLMTSRTKIPRFLLHGALIPIGSTIKTKTGYDVLENNPIESAYRVTVPVYCFVGRDDTISKPERVRQMFVKFGSIRKQFELVDGEHNSYRDDPVVLQALNWLLDVSAKRKDRMKGNSDGDMLLPADGEPSQQLDMVSISVSKNQDRLNPSGQEKEEILLTEISSSEKD